MEGIRQKLNRRSFYIRLKAAFAAAGHTVQSTRMAKGIHFLFEVCENFLHFSHLANYRHIERKR
jgi:hypothetical protein